MKLMPGALSNTVSRGRRHFYAAREGGWTRSFERMYRRLSFGKREMGSQEFETRR